MEGEVFEAARDAVAVVDGVVGGGDELYLVKDNVAERAEMEGTDAYFSAPLFGEIAARCGTQV